MSDKEDKVPVDPKDIIASLRRLRGTHKRKVTIFLKKLSELKEKDELTASFCKKQVNEIESEIAEVKDFDTKIVDFMASHSIELSDESFYNDELDSQAMYSVDVGIELDKYYNILSSNIPTSDSSTDKLLEVLNRLNFNEGKPPPLECGTFTGKEKDKFAFHSFLTQFNNVIGSRKNLSDATKQTYLYGYLKDYALKIVKHLTISDENYHLALQLLKQEFLDIDYIIDETYKNILKAAPSVDFDPEFTSVRMYLNEIRSYLHELKIYKVDLLEENTAGHSLISHVVFNKLPPVLRRELVHRINYNYPTITAIFSHYNEAIKTLSRTTYVKKKPVNKTSSNKAGASASNAVKYRESTSDSVKPKESKSTMQNFKSVNTKANVTCKLCSADGHSLGKCTNFISYDDRIDRLRELSMCTRCAGSGHDETACYGRQNKLRFECLVCKKKEHITPLCPFQSKPTSNIKTNVNLCFAQRSFDSSQILPTMTLNLKNGNKCRKVRCLIDTCSQRSYISETAARDLCQNINNLFELECDVSTYIGQDTKSFKQMSTGIRINNRLVFIPLLVDSNWNLTFEVPGMNHIINNFEHNNIGLLDESFLKDRNHEIINVDMLIGIDIIQFMHLDWNQFLGGTCLVIDNKVAPLGNIFNFLNENQRKTVLSSFNQNNESNISSRTKTMINLVMDPLKSYFNPLEHILEDSEVDNGLEHLFSLESMGIKKSDKELETIDEEQINRFRAGITFQDGYYNVELPWYQDKIELVPSNHFVALKVLDRTVEHLKRKDLVNKYQDVFDKQLEDGIIEEIKVKPSEYNNYVWIPHRPVIRTDE